MGEVSMKSRVREPYARFCERSGPLAPPTRRGEQAVNIKLPFTHDTRINRKDLVSALIFGCRISLFVGFGATLLALVIGVPTGLISAKIDIVICRLVEVWEAMPVFFMLRLVVSILQTKIDFCSYCRDICF